MALVSFFRNLTCKPHEDEDGLIGWTERRCCYNVNIHQVNGNCMFDSIAENRDAKDQARDGMRKSNDTPTLLGSLVRCIESYCLHSAAACMPRRDNNLVAFNTVSVMS